MKQYKSTKKSIAGLVFLLTMSVLMVLSSCKKSTDYVPEPRECLCGDFNWQGGSFSLLNASYILADTSVSTSRKYYITADIKAEGEDSTHSVSMLLEIPDVIYGTFFIDENLQGFSATVDEFNVNDDVQQLRQYAAVQGTVQVAPALFGGTEKVNFSMAIREVYEGFPVGGTIPFSGNFSVQIEP